MFPLLGTDFLFKMAAGIGWWRCLRMIQLKDSATCFFFALFNTCTYIYMTALVILAVDGWGHVGWRQHDLLCLNNRPPLCTHTHVTHTHTPSLPSVDVVVTLWMSAMRNLLSTPLFSKAYTTVAPQRRTHLSVLSIRIQLGASSPHIHLVNVCIDIYKSNHSNSNILAIDSLYKW